MGVEIVKASVIYGKRLSGNAYKVLIAMSLSALDKPSNGRPASLYWGGWDGLAVVLGYDHAARNSSGHKAVKRAIKELREGLHISPMVDAHRGVAQTYIIHPGGLGKRAQNDPVKGDHFGPVKGGQNGPQSGTKMTPPRKEQDSGGLTQDISIQSQTELKTARGEEAASVVGHKFEGEPSADECLACGLHYQNRKAHPIRLLRGA